MAGVRFGLIGMGRHGMRYAQHLLRDVPGAELYAICRQDPLQGMAFAREHSIQYYREYLDLLGDPKVDAVAVVTPPRLHERVCTTALAAGKAVLVEKPMACTTREAINIVEAASRSGHLLMVAHTLRFNAVVRALEAHLDEIGAIHTISMCQRLEPPERDWLDNFALAGGGATLHTGIHLFDLLRYLSGDEVRHVYCEMARVFYEEVEDAMVATMGLRHSKIRCVLDVARYAGGRSGRIELVGENGQLMGDFEHGYAMVIRGRRATPLDLPTPGHTIVSVLNAFLEALREDAEPPISAVDGYHAVEIAEACYESASTKSPVEIEGADDDEDGEDDWDALG
ncbi:MAG: Gfo/Idh/MocA family oxidoreductase [Candidatus Tectomicrobia bacterium]|uniref:Gfo/Idh/MocA family oxidoreductase n=1 Tax=Tectimicrobiota bacterium TaxID=2528274 RepID=A0A937VX57_UNCTE|nr:Gfo/Idh/MocA family oxidoreductase [Candidatus Tectomicrobia bacterium]